MSYVPFKHANTEQRLGILANDIERVADDIDQMVDSRDLTFCKLLKLQAMISDLKTKAEMAAGGR